MTRGEKDTLPLGAAILIKRSEIIKNRVLHDFFETLFENIAECERFIPEKKVTGVYRAIW